MTCLCDNSILIEKPSSTLIALSSIGFYVMSHEKYLQSFMVLSCQNIKSCKNSIGNKKRKRMKNEIQHSINGSLVNENCDKFLLIFGTELHCFERIQDEAIRLT